MRILEELAREQKLLCPDTRHPAGIRDGRIVSDDGRDFGGTEGPLNLLRSSHGPLDASSVPAADVERLRKHLGLPQTPSVDEALAQAIAQTGTSFEQSHLTAEARMLAERFRIPEFEAAPERAVRSPVKALFASVGAAISGTPRLRLQHLADYVGERLTAGQTVWRSVRVRNTGALPVAMARARIQSRWTSPVGEPLPDTTLQTELPVDIEAGREITLMVRIRAPSRHGGAVLHVELVDGERAIDAPFLSLPVQVIACELPIFDYDYHAQVLDYAQEHDVAMLHAHEFLQRQFAGRSTRFLEIGGGVHPTGHSLAERGHRVVSADISHSQSILGSLWFRTKKPELDESLAFVSCDGIELPFADAAFDGTMLFSAFHHFADPRGLLREMKRVVRPGGFIYIGCETCTPDPADAQYREELQRGINEQMFSLAEFTQMFGEAGLRVAEARIDGQQLKVALLTPG